MTTAGRRGGGDLGESASPAWVTTTSAPAQWGPRVAHQAPGPSGATSSRASPQRRAARSAADTPVPPVPWRARPGVAPGAAERRRPVGESGEAADVPAPVRRRSRPGAWSTRATARAAPRPGRRRGGGPGRRGPGHRHDHDRDAHAPAEGGDLDGDVDDQGAGGPRRPRRRAAPSGRKAGVVPGRPVEPAGCVGGSGRRRRVVGVQLDPVARPAGGRGSEDSPVTRVEARRRCRARSQVPVPDVVDVIADHAARGLRAAGTGPRSRRSCGRGAVPRARARA